MVVVFINTVDEIIAYSAPRVWVIAVYFYPGTIITVQAITRAKPDKAAAILKNAGYSAI